MQRVVPTAAEALATWATMVRANRDQAERLREAPAGTDFYAPVADSFRADPNRTDEEALNTLRALVRPGETWLDIGAGGGRYALPLAQHAGRLIAVDPSPGMLSVLREGMAAHAIGNVDIIESRWPMPLGTAPDADVALISHVGYDVEDIGPFLDAMESSARRLCVALLLNEAPASVAKRYWPLVHGEERALLPALPDFLALLLARGRFVEVRAAGAREPGYYRDVETALGFLRQQLFIQPGGTKDLRLQGILEASRTPDGIPTATEPLPLGIVTWKPR